MIARNQRHAAAASLFVVVGFALPALAQTPRPQEPAARAGAVAPAPPATATAAPTSVGGVFVPADYVVGPEDVLGVTFWRERDMSADVVVRPDGKVSLPLLNDIDVAGLTPEQVRQRVTESAKKYVEEPNATVVVKQINSRKVYITGNVERPGTFPLLRPTSVLQLIAMAGGLREFAKSGDITVVRINERGQQESFPFNYDDMKNRKNLSQNILLKPGDTVIVP